jgi:hypothetical protein
MSPYLRSIEQGTIVLKLNMLSPLLLCCRTRFWSWSRSHTEMVRTARERSRETGKPPRQPCTRCSCSKQQLRRQQQRGELRSDLQGHRHRPRHCSVHRRCCLNCLPPPPPLLRTDCSRCLRAQPLATPTWAALRCNPVTSTFRAGTPVCPDSRLHRRLPLTVPSSRGRPRGSLSVRCALLVASPESAPQ